MQQRKTDFPDDKGSRKLRKRFTAIDGPPAVFQRIPAGSQQSAIFNWPPTFEREKLVAMQESRENVKLVVGYSGIDRLSRGQFGVRLVVEKRDEP